MGAKRQRDGCGVCLRREPHPPALRSGTFSRKGKQYIFTRGLPTGTNARTPTRLETVVIEHPRLCIHGLATFLRNDADGRRHLDLGLRGAAAGHFSSDFEITVLPAYQHFRPSISARTNVLAPLTAKHGIPDLRFGLCRQHANRCERSNANGKKDKPNRYLHRSLPLRLVERGSNFAFYSGYKRSKIWLASTSKPSKRHLG